MGNWDRIWEYDEETRQAFAYTVMKIDGCEVDWNTGEVRRKKP